MVKFRFKYYHIKYVLLILYLFVSIIGNAAVYYVSSSIGNDSNPGTSEDRPWQTLNKVNKFFKLNPGDQVLFKRGDTFTGTIIVRSSGTKGNPITYGAYGTGEKPKIYGSTILTGWSLHKGNIFKAAFNKEITQLFVNDEKIKVARYPNHGFNLIKSTNNNYIRSSELSPEIDYTGAKILIRTEAYFYEMKNVISSNNQTITLDSKTDREIQVNSGFVLINKLEFLDSPGEWFFDTKTNTVYLWASNGQNPQELIVRGSVENYGITFDKKNFITIKDLNFLQQKECGINITGNNIIIDNNDISQQEKCGIWSEGNYTSWKITNNKIEDINAIGIYTYINGSIISDNVIYNIGDFEKLGTGGTWKLNGGHGMEISGNKTNKNIIQYNRIKGTNYNGIFWRGLADIKYNYIQDACLYKDDGGGIYGGGTTINNSYIAHNIIDGAIGNKSGWIWDRNIARGIYIDELGGNSIIVEKNTVTNCSDAGLFLHKTEGHVLRYNTVFNARFSFSQNSSFGSSKNNVNNNLFVLGSDTNDYLKRQVFIGDLSGANGFVVNNNTYVNYFESDLVFYNNSSYLSPKDWQSYISGDSKSTFIKSVLEVGETMKLFYNDSKKTKTFYIGNSLLRDVYGNQIKEKFSLEPFTSIILVGKNFDNINQKPEIKDQSFNFYSPKNSNYFIGNLNATDPDLNQTLTYTIINGNDSGFFKLDLINGILSTKTDIQTSKDLTFNLTIQVKDNFQFALFDTALIKITVMGKDISPPEIYSFSIPSEEISLTIPIINFLAKDDIGITGYYLTEFPNPPLTKDSIWSKTAPLNFTFLNEGLNVLYAWARDSAGNITSSSDTVKITLPDLSPTFSEYLFEEEKDTFIHDSQGINNGIIQEDFLRVNGVQGNGLSFSGSGYIHLGQSFGVNVKKEITLSAWIKTSSATGNLQGIITHGGPFDETFALYIDPEKQGIGFKTSGTSNDWIIKEGLGDIWDGNWHHITVTYDGNLKIIYLDNEIVLKINANGDIDSGWKYDLFIGTGNNDSINTGYTGLIDEVRIYNYALNPNEVGDLFNPINRELKKIEITEYVNLCEGEEYLGWKETGQYNRILKRIPVSASGADSIVITNLTVYPLQYTYIKKNICEDDFYIFGNQTLNKSGNYSKIFSGINGCDSVIYLELKVNPNYEINENITISDSEDYMGWTTDGIYHRSLISSTGCDSLITTNLTIRESVIQNIYLEKGWNIFSSYIIPPNNNMDSVLSKLVDDEKLIQVQNEFYNTYEKTEGQQTWINNIGNLERSKSYKIRVNSDCNFNIAGRQIELPLNIKIRKGLNLISYPADEACDAIRIVEPLINSGILEKIQDEKGRSIENWIDYGWINGIGNFTPGEGYILYANNDGELMVDNINEKSGNTFFEDLKTDHFILAYEGNGFEHMNINILGLKNINLIQGDEIAVFSENTCVGAVKLDMEHMRMNAVSIAASAAEEKEVNGFTEGKPVILKVWQKNSNREFDLHTSLIKGDMKFKRHGSVFIKVSEKPNLSEEINIYPNPATNKVFIQFSYLPEEGAIIYLVNVSGETVLEQEVKSHFETLNIQHLRSGIYFIKAFINNKFSDYKLVIL